MTVRGVTPIFVVRDLKETMAFYTDVLGMETAGVFPQTGEPTWCSMRLDDASVAFTFEAPHTHEDGELHVSEPAFAGSLYFYTDDVDALYDRIKEKVEIDEAPVNRPWGMREFGFVDPNGFYLAFGQDIST
jgi:uncharacterized glyoxalase superfamily protein PhnB